MKFNVGDKVKIVNIDDCGSCYLNRVSTIVKTCEGLIEPFYALAIDNGFLAWDESQLELISKANLVNKKENDNMKMRIKRMRENAKLPKIHNGNWADCYVSQIGCVDINALETGKEFTFDDIIWYPNGLTYAKEDVIVVKLGFALELPKGKELHLVPRSGTFRKTGLLLSNSFGIGDDTFIGDTDEYLAMFYATREGHIDIGDRLIQMKIEDSMPEIEFEEVESFGNQDRGGYGTTGI